VGLRGRNPGKILVDEPIKSPRNCDSLVKFAINDCHVITADLFVKNLLQFFRFYTKNIFELHVSCFGIHIYRLDTEFAGTLRFSRTPAIYLYPKVDSANCAMAWGPHRQGPPGLDAV